MAPLWGGAIMMNSQWRIGLELHSSGLRAVGLQFRRQGWRLCRWWHLPFGSPGVEYTSGEFARQAAQTLSHWRKSLPYRYQLRVSVPAQRALQQQVAMPDCTLPEPQLQRYIEQAAAAQLALPDDPLAWDYMHPGTGPARVTGVRLRDIQRLVAILRSARLTASSISPDASALQSFLPRAQGGDQWLVHREPGHWLWAGGGQWGTEASTDPHWLAQWCQQRELNPASVAFSSALAEDAARVTFSPWSGIPGLSAPLPPCAGVFTVATGLALGSLR
ncbi:DNA utilization protein HofM [Shimwellia blattae]|nr:DNA utilization protein HofM [Shimwellia blattae]